MSDENRDVAGQFAPAEPAVGREGLERDAGYVPYKEEAAEAPPEELTVREAAEELSLSRTPESEIKTYSPINDLPENVTLTLEQAAKFHSDEKATAAAEKDEAEADRIRAEVDALRGDDPEAKATEAAVSSDPHADVEKLLAIPHVKEAVEKFSSETEAVRQQYSQAVDVANEFARASFIEGFPEIAALPLDQWADALGVMAQQQPDRFNKAFSTLQRVVSLQEARQVQHRQAETERQAKLQTYVKAESARFEEMVKDIPKAQRAEIETGIVEAIKEYGGDGEAFNEFIQLMQRSEFGSALAQRLLFDVGKLRQIQRAQKSVATRNLPPVQRPGSAPARLSGGAANIDALVRQRGTVSGNKAIRLEAQILAEQRRARG
jgi:hypothetical protein